MKASSRDTIFSSSLLTDKTQAVIGKMILPGLPQPFFGGKALCDIQKTAAKETM